MDERELRRDAFAEWEKQPISCRAFSTHVRSAFFSGWEARAALAQAGGQGVALSDDFRGDDWNLVSCIEALISLSDDGALVPHGIGGHARALLSAAAVRLSRASSSRADVESAAISAALAALMRLSQACSARGFDLMDNSTAQKFWYGLRDEGYTAVDAIGAALRAASTRLHHIAKEGA